MRPETLEAATAWAESQASKQQYYRDLVDLDVDEHGRSLLEYLISTGAMVAQTPEHDYYRNYYHLVLKEGGRPRHAELTLPDDVEAMELRQCYANAAQMAIDFDEFTYVEGHAWHSFIPVPHAWLERDGVIIDPTWSQEEVTKSGNHATYMGVRFSQQLLRESMVRYGIYGLFCGDSESNHPMLRNGLVMEDGVATALRKDFA